MHARFYSSKPAAPLVQISLAPLHLDDDNGPSAPPSPAAAAAGGGGGGGMEEGLPMEDEPHPHHAPPSLDVASMKQVFMKYDENG